MINNKTFLAIVPARGGSKRLPNKNILNLSGLPLISWSINAAIKSKYIDKVMVTTDSDKIMKVAKKYGAEVPFKRPSYLASDKAIRPDVIRHVVNYYKNEEHKQYDYIVFLQPTSPLRSAKHIDEAIEYMFQKKADAISSVCEVEHPIQWSGLLPNNKDMSNFLKEADIKKRSQDLPVNYRLNGAIFICDTIRFLECNCMLLDNNIFAYIMHQNISVDIDTDIDFMLAQCILEAKP